MTLRREAEKKVKALAGRLSDTAVRGKVKLGEMTARFRQGERKASDYTRHHPGKALALAAGVGVAAGTALTMLGKRLKG